MANYKLFVPCAGTGSRLGGLTLDTNKALVKVAGKEVIRYIIEKVPEDIEIVIALGYQGEKVKSFLKENYPNRSFSFIEVDNFDGPGSGLGYSMLQCKDQLQCPFIFCSNDTIVLENISPPQFNFIGYSEKEDTAQFRSIRLSNDMVTELCEKGEVGDVKPYIGLSGIKDFEIFWEVLESNMEEYLKIGESAGLRYMIQKNIPFKAIKYTWLDTGNPTDLMETEKALKNQNP